MIEAMVFARIQEIAYPAVRDKIGLYEFEVDSHNTKAALSRTELNCSLFVGFLAEDFDDHVKVWISKNPKNLFPSARVCEVPMQSIWEGIDLSKYFGTSDITKLEYRRSLLEGSNSISVKKAKKICIGIVEHMKRNTILDPLSENIIPVHLIAPKKLKMIKNK